MICGLYLKTKTKTKTHRRDAESLVTVVLFSSIGSRQAGCGKALLSQGFWAASCGVSHTALFGTTGSQLSPQW